VTPAAPERANVDLISVVIPCYNPSDYLLEAIASVSAQTHRETEIIVVNDGSDGGESRRVLEEAARRVQVYLEQSNQGPGPARNAGIRAARGRFFAPLDADDLLEPSYLAECLAALQKDASAAFAYSDYRVFGSENYLERSGQYNLYTLLDRNFLPYSAVIRKTAWEEAGGYDGSMPYYGYEDWEFWLRLGAQGHFGKGVPKSLFRYRKHGASMYDIALAHHHEIITYMQSRHPELYKYEARARVKARWAPAVCIVNATVPAAQSIEDVQLMAGDAGNSSAPAFLVAGTGGLESHSAELAALAVWSGHKSLRLPDGSNAFSRAGMATRRDLPEKPRSQAASNKLHRHLLNAELLSWRSWIHHPVRSVARLIPLRMKERINSAAGRPVFDLSFYLQFQPNSLLTGNTVVVPLRYFPRAAGARKRVALVTPHLGPGGAEAVLWEMAGTLCSDRFETLLLATHSRDDRWLKKWTGQAEHVYDLAKVVSTERMAAALVSVVSNWRCDFIVVQNSLYGYAALPHLRRLWPGIKIIDVIHNIDEDWDLIASTSEVAGEVDIRVAVSDSVRRRLLSSGVPEDRIRLLRSGVNLDHFRPAPVISSRAEKQILFAGRLDPVKRPLLLVDIASQLSTLRTARDFRFVIAGDGPEGETMRQRVRRSGLEGVFEFRGQVEDLAPLYADSDVVVLPSRSEGVPLVVLEALACSRPVVASKVGAIPEVLGPECGALIGISPDEAAGFAHALDTLLNRSELRERMGAEGRRRVEARYDLRQAREGYTELFE
jgi:glycosyltransferase involved in cell wall biosynthesis